ncbi:hypothetical protein ACUIJ0_12240 [Acinetobacter junii]|uniref:hypothetical protein n=1 Tax=Acinetobacter junii TaxID=40215 RepID=UPI00124F7F94|nr:hypothetical protein [Acinetobacter junii]
MKVKTHILLINVAIGILLLTTITFFIVWIGFPTSTPANSFKDALSFTASIFGGFTTFGATIVAGFLFNDWKDQHNKEIEIQFISKVIEAHEHFDLKTTRMFQFDYPTIEIALRYDAFIRECLSLELDIRIIQCRYDDYYSFLNQNMPLTHKDIFLNIRRSIFQLKKTDNIIEKRELIQHRIYHDLIEFSDQYDKTIHTNLLKNLKALK